jgi:dipeptidyl aminopeptidase/acylaminoacyl peptidase
MTRHFLRLLALAPCFFLTAHGAAHGERGGLVLDGVPELDAATSDVLDGYLGARQAAPLGWSPRGQLLITTRFGETAQLHLVEQPLGARRQLTFRREAVLDAGFSPDPLRTGIVFQSDPSGAGHAQLYYQRLGEAGAKQLTDPKATNGGALWSNSGRELAFFTTARDAASHDIDIVEPESGALPHLVLAGDAARWTPLDWSPDDRKLLVSRTVSPAEASVYVVDLGSGQKREIDPGTKTGIVGARFSRDGQGIYLISDRDNEFAVLRYVNLFTTEKTVLSAHVPWDVEEVAVSRDGHYLAYVSNEAGSGQLNVLDLRTHQDLTRPTLAAGGTVDHLRFDQEGKRLAFGFGSAVLPRDAYVLDIAANRVEAWTHSEPGAVDPATFVTPRLTQFPTFDRRDARSRQIPVFVYEPPGNGPHPVLVLLHAGPEAQFRPTFDPWIQFVVHQLGFAVVAPNLRGSSGYGKTYKGLDNGPLRDDVIKDLGALVVWIGLQSDFDARHVVVSGVGYGGYLALTALVNYGDRLSGGLDVGGMSDLVAFVADADPSRQGVRRTEYGDERDPDQRAFLRRISPLPGADRITKPLLVVHGQRDTEVPISQSEQLVNRLRARGVPVAFLQSKDEDSGFERREARDAYYRAAAEFLKSLK